MDIQLDIGIIESLKAGQLKHGSLHLALGNTLDHIGNPGEENACFIELQH